MIPIRIICAWSDVEMANAIARLLSAEGFAVSLRHARPQGEIDAPNAQICEIVIWSANSVGSWPVFEQAEAAFLANRLVQVSLAGAISQLPATPGPIDFTNWSKERGHSWRTLRERIDKVSRGDDVAASPGASAAALVAASFSILAFAISNRIDDGRPVVAQEPQHDQFAANEALLQPVGFAGGPQLMEEILVEELRPVRPLRAMRAMRTSTLPPLPDLVDSPPVFRSGQLARPSLLRRVLSVAEELPFVNLDDSQNQS